MSSGVILSLMIGPLVPVPAPREVIEALSEVTVTTKDVGRSGFELKFTFSNRSPLQTLFLLAGSSPAPVVRIVIGVSVRGTSEVLMDGVVSEQEVGDGEGGQAVLSVRGEDISHLMDLEDLSGLKFPPAPAEGRVALLLAKYAGLGVIPLIVPSVLVHVPIPTSRIMSQKGTDLAYINSLAEDVGYVFYIDPGPQMGLSKAYWGPRIKVGPPQPALNIDMDAHTNVEQLSFAFDKSKNAIPTVFHLEENTRLVFGVPLPPITPLNPPLGAIPPLPTRIAPAGDDLAKLPLPQAIMIGLGNASQAAEAVSGKGTLDVKRYGRVLKARQLVGVRGAGVAFDGLHYVDSVTHSIRRGEYKQSFTLSRNGLVSTVPRVPA